MKNLAAIFLLILVCSVIQNCTTTSSPTSAEPVATTPSKQNYDNYANDKRLQVLIRSSIRKANPGFKRSRFQVTSFNGVVLLTGQVPNEGLKALATETATNTSSVRKVYNELVIGNNLSVSKRTKDSWLSTKVSATLGIDATTRDIKVKHITENATVYLMGNVTRAQGDNIANTVSNIKGVQEVVKVFEYQD